MDRKLSTRVYDQSKYLVPSAVVKDQGAAHAWSLTSSASILQAVDEDTAQTKSQLDGSDDVLR
jgi:hypothetical protein